MRHDALAYLEDIRIAADDAIRFSAGVDEETYLRNDMVRAAVERVLMIAGEAMNELAKKFPETAARIPDWRGVIGFGHVLVHGYRKRDDKKIYAILQTRLPALRDRVAFMIDELEKGA